MHVQSLFPFLALLLVSVLVSVVGGVPMPPSPRRPHQSNLYQYKRLYRAFLQPLNLYLRSPTIDAPIPSAHSNRGTFNPLYTEMLLSDHPAYIHPLTADRLNPVLLRMTDLTNRGERRPPSLGDQRKFSPLFPFFFYSLLPLTVLFLGFWIGGFVSLFEEATMGAKEELQVPLHPKNIKAQHTYPLRQLLTKYTRLLGMLENPAHLERLTGLLGVEDWRRFEEALEVLEAENELLKVAVREYAQTFPRFDVAA
ncbi:uncharacterized protein UBRO_20689 [Ustilago bromivora]|uniref:Transmembrane protein n=1 Tax=Ustilago bromivora TaxID=307758 RepID=A0A1K0G5I3_9BASI|nr:uncharacterized protein UBRO_20689 [Ustilago bromivora]